MIEKHTHSPQYTEDTSSICLEQNKEMEIAVQYIAIIVPFEKALGGF